MLILGDTFAKALSLPIPGSALGLVLLSTIFAIQGRPDQGSADLFDFAAPYFPLFFVPAAVGVVASIDVIVFSWAHFVIAIVLGTSVTLVITGLVLQALMQRIADRVPS